MFLKAGKVMGCEPDSARRKLIGQKHGIKVYQNLQESFAQKPDAVLVCTPPYSHIPVALEAINQGANVFIEKPISHTLKGIDELLKRAKQQKLIVSVGYNLRFHPGLIMIKEMLEEGKIGRILSLRAEVGQYLPDWRPWQDYQQSYTAKKAMGGGIILDASHEIDYVRWLAGEVKSVFCAAGKLSDLRVETEDTAEIIMNFRNNLIAEVHLDFIQRGYARSCKIIGEKGNIIWDYPEKCVKTYLARVNRWETYNVKAEPNDMYLDEIKHFIRNIRLKKNPLVDGIEGVKTLKVALAAKKSAKIGRVVSL
jgi:predicted dehydrogenase